jgi:hypothetical protein
MSLMCCAISGEPIQEGVVSKKSGHIFEKRTIMEVIDSNGSCPLTGQSLAEEDLVPLKCKIGFSVIIVGKQSKKAPNPDRQGRQASQTWCLCSRMNGITLCWRPAS